MTNFIQFMIGNLETLVSAPATKKSPKKTEKQKKKRSRLNLFKYEERSSPDLFK